MAAKLKKGDTVKIIAGKDRDKTGKVLQILTKKSRVIVEGQNMVKKHQRQVGNQEGGIIEREASLHISNVMVVDPSDDKPCRVAFELKDGKKRRISKRTGTVLD